MLRCPFRKPRPAPATAVTGSWHEVLEYFQEKEMPHTGLIFQRGGHRLVSLVAVWPLAAEAMHREPAPAPVSHYDDAGAWEWLWLSAYPEDTLNYVAWAELADQHPSRHLAVMERAMELRLIYPDGTLHKLANAWLNTLTAQGFNAIGSTGNKKAGKQAG